MVRNKPHVLFRADGNSKIGLGHLYRCLAIAERIKDSFDCKFAIAEPSENIVVQLKVNNISILPLATISYSHTDERHSGDEVPFDLENILKGDEIVVLDGYWFGEKYQKQVKQKGCKLVCINDFYSTQLYWADVVINHADGIDVKKLSIVDGGKAFTGFKYALLRKPFIQQHQKERRIDKIENVVICFGGADPDNITLRVLQAAAKAFPFNAIHVIIGSENQQHNQIKKIVLELANIKVHHNLNVDEMLNLLISCELAIVPASTIAMECRAVGMMMITGYTAQNQSNILKGMESLKFVKSVGDFNAINEMDLTIIINRFVSDFKGYVFSGNTIAVDPIVNIFKSLV